VRGAEKKADADIDSETKRIMGLLLEELPLKQAAALGAKITGLKKNFLYTWALEQTGREQ
jgi:16S rRNA (cytidine1402-2'-O)-methyltransferase